MPTEHRIQYIRYRFQLHFEKPVSFQTFPTFIFRSILGNQLKRMSCIMRERKTCDDCPLRHQCSYAVIFETPVPKNTPHLAGRNRYPHPFTLYLNMPCNTPEQEMDLELTLFGKAISYFPYLYFALKQAGESGVFRERIRYKIKDVIVNGQSILPEAEKLNTDTVPMKWIPETDQNTEPLQLKIEFISPVRLKIGGHYVRNFAYETFLESLRRRLILLCASYGNCPEIPSLTKTRPPKETRSHLHWADYPRYSARQKTALRLGGAIGIMEISGEFSQLELSLLTGGTLFHAGKSTAFGFGKIGIHFQA